MALHTTCDGMQRRDFLKVGAVGAAGLTMSTYLRLAEAGQVSTGAKAKSAIFINLPGGPTHMDTFDLKPDAPDEYRGEAVKAFVVLVPGEQVSEKELRDYCGKNLAPYKVPKEVEFKDEFPKSIIGKILKKHLKEE